MLFFTSPEKEISLDEGAYGGLDRVNLPGTVEPSVGLPWVYLRLNYLQFTFGLRWANPGLTLG